MKIATITITIILCLVSGCATSISPAKTDLKESRQDITEQDRKITTIQIGNPILKQETTNND